MATVNTSIGIKPRIFDAKHDYAHNTKVGGHNDFSHGATENEDELEDFYDKHTPAAGSKAPVHEAESQSIMDFIRANKLLISIVVVIVIMIAVYFLVFKKEEPKQKKSSKGATDTAKSPDKGDKKGDTTTAEDTATHKDIINNTNADDLKKMLSMAKNKKPFKLGSKKISEESTPEELVGAVQKSIIGGQSVKLTKIVELPSSDEEKDSGSDADESASDEDDDADDSDASDEDKDASDDNNEEDEDASDAGDDSEASSDADDEEQLLTRRIASRSNDTLPSDKMSTMERRQVDDKLFAKSAEIDDEDISRDLGIVYDQPN